MAQDINQNTFFMIIYQICSNFSNYKARFTMPEDDMYYKEDHDKDMFYSFNLGPIHFISINTEYYYFMDMNWNFEECVLRQYNWLQKDLAVRILLAKKCNLVHS